MDKGERIDKMLADGVIGNAWQQAHLNMSNTNFLLATCDPALEKDKTACHSNMIHKAINDAVDKEIASIVCPILKEEDLNSRRICPKCKNPDLVPNLFTTGFKCLRCHEPITEAYLKEITKMSGKVRVTKAELNALVGCEIWKVESRKVPVVKNESVQYKDTKHTPVCAGNIMRVDAEIVIEHSLTPQTHYYLTDLTASGGELIFLKDVNVTWFKTKEEAQFHANLLNKREK